MLQEADYGMTDLAMQQAQGRYANDDQLLVKFFLHPKLDQKGSKDAGRPIWKDTTYIQIMQPGNKDSIIIRPAMDMDIHRFPEHHRKFVAREDQDAVEGTLITEWPGVTRSQAEELKHFNVRTLEQLVAMSDSNTQHIMGYQMIKKRAELYLEKAKDEAVDLKLQSALDERDVLIKQLQDRLDDLEADKPKRRAKKEE